MALEPDEALDTLEKRKAPRKPNWSCQRIMGCAINKINFPRVDLTQKTTTTTKNTRKSQQRASSDFFFFPSNINHYKCPEQLNNFCGFWIVKGNDLKINNENTAQPEMRHGPKFSWQNLEQL